MPAGKGLTTNQQHRVREAIVIALTHPVDEVRTHAAQGIGAYLWSIDRSLALTCVNCLATEAQLLATSSVRFQRRYRNTSQEAEIDAHAANRVRRAFMRKGAIKGDAYVKLDVTNGYGAYANVGILSILGHVPADPVAVAAFHRAAQTLVGWWIVDSDWRSKRKRSQERGHNLDPHLSELIASFVLRTSEHEAAAILTPIVDALNFHTREVHWFLQALISAEDRQPNPRHCWAVWSFSLKGSAR